jgi:hypothetical protein
MVPRERFINKLRELGYKYNDQTDKTQEWKKLGGTHRVHIRRKEDPLSPEYVKQVLRQCGCTEDETEKFVAAANN